jgi:hypothetical protein
MSDGTRRLIGVILLIAAVGVASAQALLASCSPPVGAVVIGDDHPGH